MRLASIGLALVLGGCSRAEPTTATETTTATATPTPTPTQNANATPDANANANAPTTWSGKYTAIVGSLTVPDWTGVKFRGEDASVGLGDGAIHVTLDERGRANGTIDGALGATKIDGAILGPDFSATLVPDDLAHGFSGTAVGKRDGDHLAGTMRLSLATGNVIREASFTLDRKR